MRKSWLLLLVGLLMHHCMVRCVDARTQKVASPLELRKAFDDPDVDRIFLEDSVHLRQYNGWGLEEYGPVRLNRSVVVEGDTKWGRLVVMDFDNILSHEAKYFEPEAENLTLTFLTVHLAGLPIVRGSPDSYRARMSYVFKHSIIEMYYPAFGPEPDWPAWIDLDRAPEYPADFQQGQEQLIKPAEKEFCDTWCKVECPDAKYVYLEDVAFYFGAVNPKAAEKAGFNVEETGVLRTEDVMLLLVGIDSKTPSNSEEFEAALQSSAGHRTVINIDGYLKLWRPDLQCDTQLSRNTVIRGSSNNVPPLDLLDFNLVMNCTLIPKGVSLTIQNLLMNNSAIDVTITKKFLPWQTIVGFFAPLEGGAVNLDNAVWHVLSSVQKPLSAGSIAGDLKERGRVKFGKAQVIDINTRQEIDVKTREWCSVSYIGESPSCVKNKNCLKHVRCPNRAVQVGDVTYEFPSVTWVGSAFYRITGSLIIPIMIRDISELKKVDLLGNGSGTPKEKTPVLIILILVGLGAVGFTVAAVALTLAKLRHRNNFADTSCASSEHELGKYNSGFSDLGIGKENESGAQTTSSSKPVSLSRTEFSHFSVRAQKAAEKMFGNIVLGDLLGQGGFGRVYKATWNGAVVAVKVIEIGSESPNQESSIQREVNLLLELRHPNIVNLYQAASRPVGGRYSQESLSIKEMEDTNTSGSISSGSNPPSQFPDRNSEAWLVMEFCDRGTLRDLIRGGFFFVDMETKEINMVSVIRTCQDIARGFQYLHEQSMIHGDLKPHNILLQTSSQDARGFIAKIADFGVSRKIQGSQMYTGTVGTMTYMPPELLGQSKISNKTDVYAFGLIMWELTTGEAPFGMVTVADIWRKVVIEHYRPPFASNVPPSYVSLATRCWDNDAKLRPSFDEVQSELSMLIATVK